MFKLILYLVYTLILIFGLILGYQYYIKYRNCFTPSFQSKNYPILCKECCDNRLVKYIKNNDNKIFKTQQQNEIQEIIDNICEINNVSIYMAYNISRYLDFYKDFPSLDKKDDIKCCDRCYNRKYLNKNVEKWEIWTYHHEGHVPKKRVTTSIFNIPYFKTGYINF